jgi:DNA modification methylase
VERRERQRRRQPHGRIDELEHRRLQRHLFATFPTKLVEPCILAGRKPGDIILDPFGGSGTTTLVSTWYQRSSIYIDINEDYLQIALNKTGFNGLCHADTFEIIEVK